VSGHGTPVTGEQSVGRTKETSDPDGTMKGDGKDLL
jgi:hypothetical protein